MRYPRTPLLLSALIAASCGGPAGPVSEAQRATITQEINAVVESLTEAKNAHDADGVLSFFSRAEDFLYLGCTSYIKGGDFYAGIVGPYTESNTDLIFSRQIVNLQILSPKAVVASLQGSSTANPSLFWTEVLEKGDDGRWLITYEHGSWPACGGSPEHPGMSPEDISDELEEMEAAPSTPGIGGTH